MFNFNVPDNLKTYGSRFALGGVLAAIGVGIVKIIKEGNEPVETIYEVQSRTWTRTTDISKRKLVKESDWKAPTGAKILDTRWEFKEMKRVPSGVDANGNTTYKEVAEYATKYYYEVYKWVFDRRRTASDSEQFLGDTMTSPTKWAPNSIKKLQTIA